MGNSIEPYREGEVILLGPNLPHFWHTEDDDRPRIRAHSLVVQFAPDFLGDRIWSCPEFLPIHRMLDRAAHGLNFSAHRANRAAEMLRELPRLKGLTALSLLLETLDWLARVLEYAAKNFREKSVWRSWPKSHRCPR